MFTKYYLGDQVQKNDIGKHVERMGYRRVVYRDWVEEKKGKDHLENISVDGSLKLKWTLWIGMVKCGLNLSVLG